LYFVNNGAVVIQTTTTSIPPPSSSTPTNSIETIEWTTTDPSCSMIIWSRLPHTITDTDAEDWKVVSMAPKDQFIYRQLQQETTNNNDEDDSGVGVAGNVVPSYYGTNLWGNTFCQSFCVGLASYHFLLPTTTTTEVYVDNTEDDDDSQQETSTTTITTTNYQAYISYEHPRTAQWPPLDNGRYV